MKIVSVRKKETSKQTNFKLLIDSIDLVVFLNQVFDTKTAPEFWTKSKLYRFKMCYLENKAWRRSYLKYKLHASSSKLLDKNVILHLLLVLKWIDNLATYFLEYSRESLIANSNKEFLTP